MAKRPSNLTDEEYIERLERWVDFWKNSYHNLSKFLSNIQQMIEDYHE